jgi:hypothetical protein
MSKNLSALLRTGSSTPLTIASSTQLGGVKVDGTTITINGSGVISGANTYTLTATTTTTLGGVIIPVVGTSGITNTSGTIGIATASASQLGGVKQGSNVTIAGDGTISVAAPYSLPVSTSVILGGVIVPAVATSGISNSSGTIGLATASTTQLGGVKVDGTSITINGSGVISITEPTTTLSSTATTLTIDLTTTTTSTIIITCDTTASQAKTFNFTGTPATMISTTIFSINVIVKNNVAISSLTWQRAGVAGNVKWPNGAIPPATLTAIGTGGYDVWTFFTTDGGTTFAGSLAMYGVR